MPSSHLHALAAEADAVADSVCLRRVLNAFLTMVAGWLLYAVLVNHGTLIAGEPWWCAAPITISGATTAFAAWAVFFGDRKVWLRAFRRAASSSRRKS